MVSYRNITPGPKPKSDDDETTTPKSVRVFSDDAVRALLQDGINARRPNQPLARFNKLVITQMSGLPNARFMLQVIEMRGVEQYYKHYTNMVGDQTFVQSVRDLGTRYRIHKDNYEYNIHTPQT